jgi:hypothetical protein
MTGAMGEELVTDDEDVLDRYYATHPDSDGLEVFDERTSGLGGCRATSRDGFSCRTRRGWDLRQRRPASRLGAARPWTTGRLDAEELGDYNEARMVWTRTAHGED